MESKSPESESAVFSFEISCLEKRKNVKDDEKKYFKSKFKEWNLDGKFAEITSMDIRKIIICDDSVDILIDRADKLGSGLRALGLGSTQVRNIFSTVRQIEMIWKPDKDTDERALRKLKLLKPKLVYQTKRNQQTKYLADVLSLAIGHVKDRTHFTRFMDFFEAIVAYHVAAEQMAKPESEEREE